MNIYWVGERGFIEINGEELEGVAKVQIDAGHIDIHINIDMNLEDTKEVQIDN